MRPVLLVVLLGIAAFCAFGFAATFEPMEASQQLVWRSGYGVIGLASIAGMVWILTKNRRA